MRHHADGVYRAYIDRAQNGRPKLNVRGIFELLTERNIADFKVRDEHIQKGERSE